ncbi:flagellar biosynthesis anti-sigma factor FlgM [Yokenella regensburgei ATCC 43003]|jgi:negative regulator of flagellin synthesis FlgM|nr:flagellar biosynthesis anti-sigma factor FlgM [Yokenella regensburgei ATCC 43003]
MMMAGWYATNLDEDRTMSIDRTSPLKPVSAVQPREANDVGTQKSRLEKSSASNSTSVTLSDAQARLTQAGNGDINVERVEALKTAIRNGELKMDTGKIADALIQEAQSSIQSK